MKVKLEQQRKIKEKKRKQKVGMEELYNRKK